MMTAPTWPSRICASVTTSTGESGKLYTEADKAYTFVEEAAVASETAEVYGIVWLE